MAKDIVVIVGSLRKESFNRKMANALRELAPASLKLEIVEIGQLPLYNQDLDRRQSAGGVEGIPRPREEGRRRAVRHAGIQSLDPGAAQECDRCRLASLWPERLGQETRGRGQRLARL